MLTRNAHSILQPIILCFLGSILVGYVAYGGRIFEPGLVYHQFVFSGLICATYLVALRRQKPRYAMAAGAAAFVAWWFSGTRIRGHCFFGIPCG